MTKENNLSFFDFTKFVLNSRDVKVVAYGTAATILGGGAGYFIFSGHPMFAVPLLPLTTAAVAASWSNASKAITEAIGAERSNESLLTQPQAGKPEIKG